MAITKEDILQEIHKVVATIHEAPGEREFRNITRIKQTSWKGKFWVRWTDAVREAGYDPQSMIPRMPDEALLQNCAEYIGRLGHFPVRDEINMESRAASGVPHWTTVKRRYGGMPEFAAALLKHSRKSGNEIVAALCETRLTLEKEKTLASPAPKQVQPETKGFVYLAYSPSLRLYKIGMARVAEKRIARISLLLPDDLFQKHDIKTDNPSILEQYWHDRFRTKRRQGEWFDLNKAEVESFKGRSSFVFREFFP